MNDKFENRNIVISSPVPDPKVNGKEFKRDIKISGIQIKDDEGNEIGGIGTIENSRTALMALDYSNREAVVIYVSDDEKPSAGININGKTNVNFDTLVAEPTSNIQIAIEDRKPRISILGRDGKPRIEILLDEEDNPSIILTSSSGKQKVIGLDT